MLLFVVSNTLMAQGDEPFTASVKVQFKTGDEVTTKPLRYALFKTPKKANDIKAILEATMPEISSGTNPLAFDEAVTKYNLNFKKSKANGTFNVRVQYPGQALLITSFGSISIEPPRTLQPAPSPSPSAGTRSRSDF